MVEVWIKIFESNGRQIAVEKFSDDDELSVKFRWHEGDFTVDVGPLFKNDGEDLNYKLQDKFFQEVDQAVTDKMVNAVLEQMGILQ